MTGSGGLVLGQDGPVWVLTGPQVAVLWPLWRVGAQALQEGGRFAQVEPVMADDLDEYVRINSIPGAARAGMEWYAAGLRRDAHDLVSIPAKLHVPVLAYGGAASLGDLRSIWTEVATDVSGGSVENCGHFIPEETPEFLLEEALAFFGSLNAR